jgi:hypothetical protein
MDDHVNDDGEHDADNYEGNDGEIKGEIVLLDKYISRQLAEEGDMLCEDEQQPDHDNNAAEDEEYFAQAR